MNVPTWPLEFILSPEYVQYIQYNPYHMMLLRPEFVAEWTAGLSLCAHCALLTDEVDKLSHKIIDNRQNFKLLKCIQIITKQYK